MHRHHNPSSQPHQEIFLGPAPIERREEGSEQKRAGQKNDRTPINIAHQVKAPHPPPRGLRQRIADIHSLRPTHPGKFHPGEPLEFPNRTRENPGTRLGIDRERRRDSPWRASEWEPKESAVPAYQPLWPQRVAVLRVTVDFILLFR